MWNSVLDDLLTDKQEGMKKLNSTTGVQWN